MTDFETAGWAVVVAIWLALVVYVYWLVARIRNNTLLRCPETGSIALVSIRPAARRAGDAPEVEVYQCILWPGKKDCARGCLARYRETAPGYRVNLYALRPFEPR